MKGRSRSQKMNFTHKLSKGERKGWLNREEYITVPVNSIKWESKKIEAYPANRYGLPKLVP